MGSVRPHKKTSLEELSKDPRFLQPHSEDKDPPQERQRCTLCGGNDAWCFWMGLPVCKPCFDMSMGIGAKAERSRLKQAVEGLKEKYAATIVSADYSDACKDFIGLLEDGGDH